MASRLTAKRRLAAQSLIERGSSAAAAEECGVARQTIDKWRREPEFRALLKEYEDDALRLFQTRLAGMSTLAAKALYDALQDGDIRIRLRAADIFTQRLFQLREILEFEERLTALENANDAQQ